MSVCVNIPNFAFVSIDFMICPEYDFDMLTLLIHIQQCNLRDCSTGLSGIRFFKVTMMGSISQMRPIKGASLSDQGQLRLQ